MIQQSLFETQPPPWEQDDQSEKLVATVVFPTGPEQPLDYLVPDRLVERAELGRRVRVPLGKGDRLMTGYLVEMVHRPADASRLKPLAQVVDERSLLGPAMLRLTRWMADYYLCSWGQVLETVLPAGVRWRSGTREKIFVRLAADALEKAAALKLSAKQREIIELAAQSDGPIDPAKLAKAVGCTLAPINLLRKRGLLTSETRRTATAAAHHPDEARQPHLTLNSDQRRALDAILAALESRSAQTILLHGVTGSGKTEVYIQAIDEVLRYGRQAIVLVPEISLTPQTEQRFRSRFGRVAVLHSHQSDVERHRHWQQIAAGEVPVVVGARSAIFAPTPHLGLIVLDEEHEASFKQDSSPRYHARDVALARARMEQIPLVLGSATPSLESWHRAEQGLYKLVSLPQAGFRAAAARRRHDRPAARISESQKPRSRQPAIARGHGRGLEGRRPGDFAAQSPRLFDPHPMPGLRPCRPLSALLDRPDPSPDRPIGDLPLLRLSDAAAGRLSGMPLSRHSLLGRGHAAAGSRGESPISRSTAACGWTPTRCRSRAATSGRWPPSTRAK